jgi:hypothetical protein
MGKHNGLVIAAVDSDTVLFISESSFRGAPSALAQFPYLHNIEYNGWLPLGSHWVTWTVSSTGRLHNCIDRPIREMECTSFLS